MPQGYGYTTINVYPEDRDIAKRTKRAEESWSDYLRRAADVLEADCDDIVEVNDE